MRSRTLIRRNLTHYWRSNLAVIAGVAVAVSVLAGALLVGESVRASLRRMALERLGNTETVVRSAGLFREQLADEFKPACPLLTFDVLVTHQTSGLRATQVAAYGVDQRFWRFHEREGPALENRQAALSAPLAAELGVQPGDTVLLKLEKPSAIPAESLYGRKEDAGITIRLTVEKVLSAAELGEFSLKPQQGGARAIFLPLALLQREIGAGGKANTILAGNSGRPAAQILRETFWLEDLGVRLRALPAAGALQLDTASGVLSDWLANRAREAAEQSGLTITGALTYLATTMRVADREIPYSLVGALDLAALGGIRAPGNDAIVLNEWAARDLNAQPGQALQMEYLLWHDDGRIATASADFRVAAVVPIRGLAADRELTPEYPGITDTENVTDWDPPFPIDLSRIRPRDEDYWDGYRTTPKAFLPLERGQQLWQSRFGKLTTLRLLPPAGASLATALETYRSRLRESLDPLEAGLAVIPLREQNLAASRGATDFGEYFVYFSFFLMVSALLLAGLFFRLGVEQRSQEVGLLLAVGFPPARLGWLFVAEAALLAAAGGLAGAAGSLAYAGLILTGLGSWWVDAVGTRDLSLEAGAAPLAAGVLGGIAASLMATLVTLRGLRGSTARQLLAGGGDAPVSFRSRGRRFGLGVAAVALLLVGGGYLAWIPAAGAFFGAGTLLLIGGLAFLRGSLAASLETPLGGTGPRAWLRFAFRNAAHRPGRTVLSAALVASATFLIVSMEAFRRGPHAEATDPHSGTGGYPLLAESVRPVYHNLNAGEGREALNLGALSDQARFVQFRLRPGDDASCLNLYQPRNPRILGAPAAFLRAGRFRFSAALAEPASENSNPWLLLEQDTADGAIPAIADANSMTYVLHKRLGEEIVLAGAGGEPVRLRLVAALADSIFQSELIISEQNFIRLFPALQGYRVFLIDVPHDEVQIVTAAVENALSDHGLDAVTTADKLASFHRVENTYLSTFQTLGGLGLLLGTAGMAAILFRNVLERRRELALLKAVGYQPRTLERLVLTENVLVLAAGLNAGVAAAALAIAPVLAERGVQFSLISMVVLIAAVAVAGVAVTAVAARAALRLPLLESLRTG